MTGAGSPRAASLVRLAVRNLLVHKLRSTLSIVGVVFGVGAVTAVSAVGEGARREAVDQIGDLGIDTITVRAKAPVPGGPPAALRVQDAAAVRAVGADVVAVAPVRETMAAVQGAGRSVDAGVVGTTADYASAARLRVSSGRFLAGLDVEERKRVAVLGASIASDLFPLTDPRGQRVLVGGDWYDVVGVAEGRSSRRGRGGPIRSRDVNRAVFVPLMSLDRGADPRPDGIDEIVLRVDDAGNVTRSAEVVKAVVRRTSGSDAFDVIVPREILRQKERTQRIFNVVTGAIAAISLLVGGIGIMNIMLASVAERTREVGIRRAVGASRRDIGAQFLVESSLLTATGGVLGTLLGIFGSFAIQRLAGWPTALSLEMLLTGLVTATAVGLGFGFYPAWEAAHLEPMDALRRD
jgi:putative ABC transport system permease protein